MKRFISFISLISTFLFIFAEAPIGKTAKSMKKQGMVNIHDIAPSIKVSLMYARHDNFCNMILYEDLRQAYLHPKAAKALARAQERLKKLRPDLTLKIYDACRPMSIQQKMWDKVKHTKKYFYVSNPAHGGGMHNYGMAVDITICNANNDTIRMGTKIDAMTYLSHIDKERQLVNQHKISKLALANRRLLREVMEYAGFTPLRTEWWHFNYISRSTAKRYYKVIR